MTGDNASYDCASSSGREAEGGRDDLASGQNLGDGPDSDSKGVAGTVVLAR
jgi:hypothetical protein